MVKQRLYCSDVNGSIYLSVIVSRRIDGLTLLSSLALADFETSSARIGKQSGGGGGRGECGGGGGVA